MEVIVKQTGAIHTRGMIVIKLISKEDCHLCDRAKEVLLKTRNLHPFELEEIKIKEGDDYFKEYNERIPVVLINEIFAFQYKVSEQELLRKLKQLSS